ncbi:hypothetical protein SDC9_169818 [bioreactor metagenome]|uniref:Uncharacterized protein n=1 Tax=bioreactor metagenome TaxID=1076179 RepID=A0A645G713_9ZZZZ
MKFRKETLVANITIRMHLIEKNRHMGVSEFMQMPRRQFSAPDIVGGDYNVGTVFIGYRYGIYSRIFHTGSLH